MSNSMCDRRADGIWRRVRRWWRALTCRHRRTFRFFPDGATWVRDGVPIDKHQTIKVEGCCDCGRVVGSDYGE